MGVGIGVIVGVGVPEVKGATVGVPGPGVLVGTPGVGVVSIPVGDLS